MASSGVWRAQAARLFGLVIVGALTAASLVAIEVSTSAPVAADDAVEDAPGSQCSGSAADRAAALVQAAACGIRVESLADRTEWDSLFAEVDGVSFTWESSAKALRSRVSGEWTSVSTLLVADAQGFSPASSALPMSFGGGGDAVLARIGRDGHELVMSSPLPGRLPTPVVSGSSLIYPAVLPGVDLIVTVNEDGTGFSQVLRVATRAAAAHPALAELVFPVETSEELRVLQRGGGFVAVDDAGAEVFTSPAPRMWDSAGVVAEQAGAVAADVPAPSEVRAVSPLDGDTVAVMPMTASQDAVTVRPVGGLLADSRTVWPVFIDPSVSGSRNEWVMIQSGFGGDDNNWKFSGDEGTGRCNVSVTSACVQDNTKRIIWEFGFPAAARGKHITAATFKAYQANAYDCDTGWVRVYKTAAIASGTVWDNFHTQMDGTSNSLRSVDETRRPGCALGPGWTSWSITSGVQASADANATWIGLGVRSTNETSMPSSWKRFRYDATLSITYNTKPGTPTLLAPSAGVITPDSTPTLQAKSTDADGNSVRFSFEIATSGGTLVKSTTTGYVASGATASWTPSALTEGNYKFRARAYDGIDYGAWSGYRNFSVDLTGPAATNAKTNGSGCGQQDSDSTPTFSVVLTDNYGGNVTATFEVRPVGGTATTFTSSALPSGSTFHLYDWCVGQRLVRVAGPREGLAQPVGRLHRLVRLRGRSDPARKARGDDAG